MRERAAGRVKARDIEQENRDAMVRVLWFVFTLEVLRLRDFDVTQTALDRFGIPENDCWVSCLVLRQSDIGNLG